MRYTSAAAKLGHWDWLLPDHVAMLAQADDGARLRERARSRSLALAAGKTGQ